MGAPASLQVFRAGRNFYRLRMASWWVAQLLALGGIIFWAVMLIDVEAIVRTRQQTENAASASAVAENTKAPVESRQQQPKKSVEDFTKKLKSAAEAKDRGWAGFRQFFVEIALVLPAWAFPVLWGLKIISIGIYLSQIPLTYTVRRLDYEMRWYMVTDRSLRLRHGIWKVVESTMSFANVQEVVMTQGPLQRLLGLADVKVKSAGGGGGKEGRKDEDDMHLGVFRSVTNAAEIRDLIIERLRRFRESGLGDPEEPVISSASVLSGHPAADTLTAARELAAEARALRIALS